MLEIQIPIPGVVSIYYRFPFTLRFRRTDANRDCNHPWREIAKRADGTTYSGNPDEHREQGS